MSFPPPDPQNYARLASLGLDAAIQCFVDGDFTIGEESALVGPIQKGLKLPLSNERIEEIMSDCMADELSVDECKRRLFEAC